MVVAPILEVQSLPAGTQLGPYRVIKRLAIGGMAELYLVSSENALVRQQLFALKRVHPHLAHDEEFIAMLHKEATIASSLVHPHIATVVDSGTHAEAAFFVMEYIHGENLMVVLREVARRGAPQLGPALYIIAAVAEGLHYAHERCDSAGRPMRIVHRDISPSNVMVGFDGAVKLVDFGIAAAWAGTRKTQAGILKGKIGYMSPEQCRGEDVDRRSDVFGLGILLYEVTTHRRPFRGDSPYAVMNQIANGKYVPPSEVCEHYPAVLAAIIERALARRPERRYPDADAFRQDLVSAIDALRVRVNATAIREQMGTLFGAPGIPELALVEEIGPREQIVQARHGTRAWWSRPSSPGLTVGLVAGAFALGALVVSSLRPEAPRGQGERAIDTAQAPPTVPGSRTDRLDEDGADRDRSGEDEPSAAGVPNDRVPSDRADRRAASANGGLAQGDDRGADVVNSPAPAADAGTDRPILRADSQLADPPAVSNEVALSASSGATPPLAATGRRVETPPSTARPRSSARKRKAPRGAKPKATAPQGRGNGLRIFPNAYYKKGKR